MSEAWDWWQELFHSSLRRQRGMAKQFLKYAGHGRKYLPELKAFRTLCKKPDVEQYVEDMRTLAENGLYSWQIEAMLQASGFDEDGQREWLENAKEAGFVVTQDTDKFMSVAEITNCVRCEEHYESGDDLYEVVTSLRPRYAELWCSECRDNHSFNCNTSGDDYVSDNFTAADDEDGNTICEEYVRNRDGWMYSEYATCWVSPDNWDYENHTAPEDREEEEEEEEEEVEFNLPEPRTVTAFRSIPPYHGALRNWNYTIARRSWRSFFGFELEVLFPSNQHRYDFWKQHLELGKDMCGEADSTLDNARGMEIVTRPFALEELSKPNLWEDCVARLREVPVETPDRQAGLGTYGLHVTTNWQRLRQDHHARAARFIFEAKHTIKALARRESSYAAFQYYQRGEGHHTAISPRSDGSEEFRAFNATTDWSRIMAAVELLEAVVDWTTVAEHTWQGTFAGMHFRQWLKEEKKEEYPNLLKLFTPQQREATVVCA